VLFPLSGERDKLRLMAGTGLDGAFILRFDAAFAATTADEFIARILCGQIGVAGVAVGYDFHFGKARQGSPSYLAEQGAARGFPVDIVPPLQDEGRPVSSGAIRAALTDGKVVEAAELLGAPWFVSGEVIHGEKRGRDLGFPTANVRLDPGCGLKHGIYAVRMRVDGRLVDGVASFGRRPTFDNGGPLLETFLFDFTGDLYGKTVEIAFIGWLRGELKFDGIEPLKAAMAHDVVQARAALARHAESFPPMGDI
jgi:riboflavin kinase/FMN adenylyltransferase